MLLDDVIDLGEDWEMTLDRDTSGKLWMRLTWLGGDPRVELEIPPGLPDGTLIMTARILAMTYERGYNAGCRDERNEIIASLSMRDWEGDLREGA